jgi:hypothetical protein
MWLPGRSARFQCVVICSIIIALLAGCTSRPASNSEVGDMEFVRSEEMQHKPLIKFSGRVTVDGQPPKKDCKLFVIFNDPAHLDENSKGTLPKYYEGCDDDGKFNFSTYDKGDGVPFGKYVVTFVELRRKKIAPSKEASGGVKPPSASRRAGGPSTRFLGPDELRGIYSDPEKNAKEPAFILDLHEGSSSTRDFALVVGDKKGSQPAPHAVQTLVLRP